MRTALARVFLLSLLLLGIAGAAQAQTGPFIPAIISFAADVDAVTLAEVEAGDVNVTLSWYIVNVVDGQSLALDYFRQSGWVSVLNEGEALPPIGERTVTLLDPLNFGPPTFRLTLISGRNVVDQRFLIIPYEETDAEPSIVAFTTTAQNLDTAALNARTATAEVSWQVANRLSFTNLIFEQVLAPGQTVNVELPRPNLYVASEGRGAVQPVTPTTEAVVRLRLTVISALDGTIFDTAELLIPLSGAPLNLPTPAPTLAATPTMTLLPPEAAPDEEAEEAPAEPETPPAVEISPTGPQINTFNVSPSSVPVGGNVTLTWSVADATTVQISEVLSTGVGGLTYVQLPLSGSVSVPLPAGATGTVTYVLTARNAAGETSTSQATVTITP